MKLKLYSNLLFIIFLFTAASSSFSKEILGQAEKIMLVDTKTVIDAKLDTGAEQSSLSAEKISYINYRNQKYVRFQIKTNHKNISLTLPFVKYVHILKRKNEMNSKDLYEKRPVARLEICVGRKKHSILVNLIDRTHFQYPMLLGSDDLKELNVYVDVSQKFLTKPTCGTRDSEEARNLKLN